MKVRFLRDHRGYETDERYYTTGQVADLPARKAAALLANGWARKVGDREVVAEPVEAVPLASTTATVPLADVPGAAALEDALNEIGIRTAHDLAHATKVFLTRAQGIGEKRAEQLRQAARDLLYPEPAPDDNAEDNGNGAG